MLLFSKKILDKNLSALSKRDNDIYTRLLQPVSDSFLKKTSDDLYYIIGNGATRINGWKPPAAARTNESVRFFYCGADTEGHIGQILRGNPEAVLYHWDRNPYILRIALMTNDYAEFIESGRLILKLGTDILSMNSVLQNSAKLIQPFFQKHYQSELSSAPEGENSKRALICRGTLFIPSMKKELLEKGFQVYTLEHDRLSLEEINRTFGEYSPDIVFSINYVNGLAEMCQSHGTKLICWEIDPTVSTLKSPATPVSQSFIFTYRKKNRKEYLEKGFPNAEYTPLAADPSIRYPEPPGQPSEKEIYEVPISFIGASMKNQAAQNKKQFVELHKRLFGQNTGNDALKIFEELIEFQKSDFAHYNIPEKAERLCPLFLKKAKDEANTDICMLAAEEAAHQKRLFFTGALADNGIRVWGDEGWKEGLSAHGATYMGPARHLSQLNRIYSGSTINLDINRIYQQDIITMRVFDVLACGGFVLTEDSLELREIFTPGVHLETYTELADLIDKAGYFIKHPDKARSVAEAGRKLVIAEHTISKRFNLMMEVSELENT
ncbi:MAG: glycosyltransferase [Fibrobacterota bacterium]